MTRAVVLHLAGIGVVLAGGAALLYAPGLAGVAVGLVLIAAGLAAMGVTAGVVGA